MAKAKVMERAIQNRKFRIAIDKELDTATGKFVHYKYPISSREIDDFIVLHYENKSGRLIGFTILHLRRFMAILDKRAKNRKKEQRLKEKQWLKERAQQAIYEIIRDRQIYDLFYLPEPFWHKGRFARFL